MSRRAPSGIQFKLSGRQRPISVDGYRRVARRRLPAMVWTYVDDGADSMFTLRANSEAFGRWSLRQRVLGGPNPKRTEVSLDGTKLALPIAGAPTGLNGLAHWEGDLAVARGAEEAGTVLFLSSAGSYSIEEVAEAARGDHWFQLYPWSDHEVTGQLIERARKAGYRGLVVTADTATIGNREGERLVGMGTPPILTPRRALDGALHPRWAYGFLRHRRVVIRNLSDEAGANAGVRSAEEFYRYMSMDRLGWEDFSWIRDLWDGPLYLKGVLDSEDAQRAVELGANGIIVSNHGGRQLDYASAALDALPAIADTVGGRASVLLDGGIRRGTDVIKALCLGADACLIGRPLVYGLAVDGQRGVSDVFKILGEELNRAMVLMGCKDISELDRSWLLPAGELVASRTPSELTGSDVVSAS